MMYFPLLQYSRVDIKLREAINVRFGDILLNYHYIKNDKFDSVSCTYKEARETYDNVYLFFHTLNYDLVIAVAATIYSY